MDKYADLITQVKVRMFKRVPFTLYNYVSEESGFLHMLSKKGYDNDIDNLECLQIEIIDDEKKNIKKGVNGRFDAFSKYIEERTDNTMNVFIMKQYGCVFVVKPKNTTSPFFTFLLSPTKIPNHGNHLFYNLNRILPEHLFHPCNN